MRFVAALALFPMAAFAVTVEPLPPSEFADTEISTNIAFVVDRSMMTRIEFTVELDATQTNNVEVAISADENGDGNLSVEEAAYTFGYDCGMWFKRSKSELVRVGSPSPTMEDSNIHCTTTTSDYDYPPTTTPNYDFPSHTFILKKRKLDTAWDLVKVTRRGFGAACELVKAEGRKPGFKLEVR